MFKYFKIRLPVFLAIMAMLYACSNKVESEKKEIVQEQKPWSVAMADSEIKRNPSAWMLDFRETPHWGYVNGLVCSAMLKVWEDTEDQKYYNYVLSYADTLIDKNGDIKGYNKSSFNIDQVNSVKILFSLYETSKDERYKKAIETLYDQLKDQPRVPEGGFWHKKVYENQMWLDGIFMGTPFYAQYAATYGVDSAFNDIALQFELIEKHARDSETGWYYHGWDASKSVYWADPETGLSKNFWGRGVGWLYMALIDVLDFFPKDHPKRKALEAQFIDLSNTIVKNQDERLGVWYQVLDQPDREGNYPEATCSTMFVYGLLKGVEKNILDDSFITPAKKGYEGILENLIKVHEDGEVELLNCCAGAGLGPADNPVRDGTYDYYINEAKRSNDGKGTAPFIMASLILENSEKLN